MAKNVPAARLSIELVAEIARLQADLDKAKKMVSAASGDIAKSAKAANDNLAGMGRGMATATKSAGQMRSGMQQLSFQLNDVASGFSSGTPPMQIFAQQASQVVQALQLMNGSTKGLMGFLAGPWGAVLTAATVVLAPFVMKLFEGSEGSKAHEKALKEQAKAIDELDNVTGRGNKTLEQRIILGVAATKQALLQAQATRVQTQAELQRMLTIANAPIGASPRGEGLNAGAAMAQDVARRSVVALNAQLKETNAAIAENEERLRAAGRPALMANIVAATDKHAAAVKRLKDAQTLLDQAFDKGKIGTAEYTKRGIALQKQLHAEEKAITDAKKATAAYASEQKKAAREAIKHQKEYEKSLLGRVQSGTFLGQVATELGKSRDEFMKGVGEDWARDLRETVKEFQNAQDFASDERVRQDEKTRTMFLRSAHDFADIVGGRLGQAISAFANILDKHAKGLTSAFGKALDGISSGLGAAFKTLGAGAAIGTGVAGIMKGIGLGKTSTTGAAIGGAAGMMIGGPVGAIAGSILGGVVGGLLKKVKKASATIEIMAGEATQTSLSGNSAKLKAAASKMADGLIGGLTSIADQLGGMLGDGIRVSIGQRKDTFRVDLQGLGRTKNMPSFKTEDEAIAFAIQEVIRRGAIIGLKAGTQALIRGEGDLQTQLQKALQFEQVFKDLEQAANPAKASMAALTKQFADLADIFDEAGASAEDYAALQKLMAIRQKEVIEQAFEPLRSMLDDLKGKADAAGDAVRTAFDAVLSREAEAIEAYRSAVEAQAEAAREAFNAGQQRWLDAVTTGFNEEIERMKTSVSALRDEAQGLAAIAERLRGFSADVFRAAIPTRFSATGIMSAAAAGDVDALGRFKDVAASGATSRIAMIQRLALVRSAASGAANSFDARAAAANAQADAIERQISGIEKQIELAKTQVKLLEKVETSTTSIEDLLKNMQTAKAAADAARDQMSKLTELTEAEISFADAVAAYEKARTERDDLLRQITEAGFGELIDIQKQTAADLLANLSAVRTMADQALSDAASRAADVMRAQANANVVNDNGYNYDLSGLPMFYRGAPVSQTNAHDIGKAVASEVMPALFQIAKNTSNTAGTLDDWDRIGQPDTRAA